MRIGDRSLSKYTCRPPCFYFLILYQIISDEWLKLLSHAGAMHEAQKNKKSELSIAKWGWWFGLSWFGGPSGT
jgi:hypothetical protein